MTGLVVRLCELRWSPKVLRRYNTRRYARLVRQWADEDGTTPQELLREVWAGVPDRRSAIMFRAATKVEWGTEIEDAMFAAEREIAEEESGSE